MTALDLIKLSLKMAGVLAVGATPMAEDVNDAFTLLNSMLASWNQSRWMIWHLVDVSCASTGAQSYSVGIGGNFNVTRPDRLESAYARVTTPPAGGSGSMDFPLTIISTMEEYAAIGLKQLQSFPGSVFYDATIGSQANPLGTVYFYPIPSVNYQLHIIVKETLSQFPSLTTVINLPPEYTEALIYNLTTRLMLLYQLPINPGVATVAATALNTIRVANNRVPLLSMPVGIANTGGWTGHDTGGIAEFNLP